MALTWSDVAANPAFQALTPDEQEEARQQYFDDVIATQIPEEDLGFARTQYDEDTISSVRRDYGPQTRGGARNYKPNPLPEDPRIAGARQPNDPSLERAVGRLPGNIARSAGAELNQQTAGVRRWWSDLIGSREAEVARRHEAGELEPTNPTGERRWMSPEDIARDLASRAGPGASERAFKAELEQGRAQRDTRRAQAEAQAAIPADAGPIERAVQSGLSSAAITIPIVTLGATVPGGQAPALLALGGMSASSRYGELRAAGIDEGPAALSAAALGGLEVLTERAPLTALAKKSPFMERAMEFLVQDLLGENVSSLAQIADDYRLQLRDDVTMGDIQQSLKETTASTVVSVGAQLTVSGLMDSVLSRANARAEARAPQIQGPSVEEIQAGVMAPTEIPGDATNYTPPDSISAQIGLTPIVVPNITPDKRAEVAKEFGLDQLQENPNVGLPHGAPAVPQAGGAGAGVDVAGGMAVAGSTTGVGQLAPAAAPAGDQRQAGAVSDATKEQTAPVETWFGRRGDGYVTEPDAMQALPGRQKRNPDLAWKVEPMANGKYRLAGYGAQPSAPAEDLLKAKLRDRQTGSSYLSATQERLAEEQAIEISEERGIAAATASLEPTEPGTDFASTQERLAEEQAIEIAEERGIAAASTALDTAAHEAATSPTNDLPEPTDAQKEAGNYKKGRLRVQGLDISIENPAGSIRKSKADAKEPWEVTMPAHYGYFRGTTGADGDHIDVTLGKQPDNEALPVFVFDQTNQAGKFDEHKVFMGFANEDEARGTYRSSFAGEFGKKMESSLIGVRKFTPGAFKEWLASGDHSQPASEGEIRVTQTAQAIQTATQGSQASAGVGAPAAVPAAGAAAPSELRGAELEGLKLAPPAPNSVVKAASVNMRAKRGVEIEPVSQENMSQGHRVASAIARVFGKTLTVVKHKSGNGRKLPNGFINGFGGKHIFIADDTQDAPMSVAVHEIYHSIPAQQRVKLNAALLELTHQDKRAKFGKQYNVDEKNIEEELPAYMVQAISKRDDFWEELREKMGNKEFSEVARVILEKLDELLTGFSKDFGDEFLKKYVKDVDRARALLTDAYAAAKRGDAAKVEKREVVASSRVEQTQSAAFKRWFGNSKVVDKNGEPLVVYHGTDVEEDFDTFERSDDIGFHFGSELAANHRIGMTKTFVKTVHMLREAGLDDESIEGRRVMPVYLRIENPLRMSDLGMWEPSKVASALVARGVITEDQADAADLVDREQVATWLSAKGYDGIVYKNHVEGRRGEDSYIVFDPRQIKSAIGNDGSFDPESPSIVASNRAEFGDYDAVVEKDGSITVEGDVDEIRELLPDDVVGRETKDGLKFRTSDAARVRAALEGRKVAYGRGGEVTERLAMRDGKYLGAPEKFNTPAKVPHLRKWLKQLALEGKPGRMWYENSSDEVLRMVGGDVQEARKFAALLAIYSPQAKVDTNATFALRAWAQHKAGKPISVKTRVMDQKATEALSNVDAFWSGEKTGNFVTNLLRQIDPSLAQGATIDMWMMRAAQYSTDAPGSTQYAFMENEVNRLARELKWEPQQVQAAIWVAMKARMENKSVKQRTEAKSEKRRWIRFETHDGKKVRKILDKEAHRNNWLETAFAHTPTAQDTTAAKFDFGDGLRRHIGQVSFEARPGRSTGVLPGAHDAPYTLQLQFQQDVQKALYDKDGIDLLAQKLGLLVDSEVIAPGVWRGEVSPSSQKSVAMAPGKGDEGKKVDHAQAETLNVYAAVLGLLSRQEGVGWHRPFPVRSKAESNGVQIDIGRPLNPREVSDLSGAIGRWMNHNGYTKWHDSFAFISSPKGIRLVNFGVVSNDQLQKQLIEVAEGVLPDFEYQLFKSDGDMPVNDWRRDPNGQGYVQRIRSAGRSDVLDWARDVLAPRVQDVFERYSEEQGWGDPGELVFSNRATAGAGEEGLSDEDGLRGSAGSVARDRRPYQRHGGIGTTLEGLPREIEVDGKVVVFDGFHPAQDVARRYMERAGLPYSPPRTYAKIDRQRGRRIAESFTMLIHDPRNPEVKLAYQMMINETIAQYREILGTGLQVEFIRGDDPYGNPRNAILDVVENNHLWVFPTSAGFGSDAKFDASDNPLLAETEFKISGETALANDIFRVVHDYFGHIKDGIGFRAEGEENAWRSHSAMYSPLARRAMTVETRGQNSWVNFGPHGEKNKTASGVTTVYADQKIGLLPKWVSEEGAADEVVEPVFSDRVRDNITDVKRSERNPDEPVYLRIGDWNPDAPRSRNYSTGDIEVGLSAYDLDDTLSPVEEALEGEHVAEDLRERLASDDPKYLVQGDYVGTGGDGEPLLANVRIVGEWAPDGKSTFYSPASKAKIAVSSRSEKKQTDIQAFKRWFGDSKVVNESGEPMVVYHGASSPRFDEFKPNRYGYMYFVREPSYASFFAGGSGAVYPVYLSIKNPLDLTSFEEKNIRFKAFMEWLQSKGVDTKNIVSSSVKGPVWDLIKGYDRAGETLKDRIVAAGFDGLAQMEDDGFHTVYVAFDPKQIKSATGNDGSFDAESPSIVASNRASRPLLIERDKLGNFRFAAGARAYRIVADIANAVLDKVKLKPVSSELGRAMRRMRADIEAAKEKAANVAGKLGALSPEEREMISDVIEGELRAGITPTEKILAIAANMQHIMSEQTKQLVELDMISKDSAERWEGKYLPRFYQKQFKDELKAWAKAARAMFGKKGAMQGISGNSLKARGLFKDIKIEELPAYEQNGWEVRDPSFDPADADEVTIWRDFTKEERAQMNEIRDAMFRFVMGYMRSQKDIALGRLYRHIANTMASHGPKDGYVQVPDTSVEGTTAKRYGQLAGKWVPQEVMDHLSAADSSDMNELFKLYLKGLSAWKEGRTVLNPVSHVNNVVSNVTMAHMAGVSYWDAHKYVGAVRDLVKKDPMVQEAKEAGLFGGTFNQADLMNSMPEQLKVLAGMAESAVAKNAGRVWNAMSFWLRKPMQAAYEGEDLFFRYLIYRDARQRGVDPDAAVEHAQEYIFTYDDLPKGARAIRDTVVPFFSWTYKAIPALARTAFEYPWRFAAPAAVLWGANTAMYAIAAAGADGEEEPWWESVYRYIVDPEFRTAVQELEAGERKDLPPWNRGNTAIGTPKVVRMGLDDVTQLPMFLDVSRLMPGGDMFDTENNAGGLPWFAPIEPGGPAVNVLFGMFGNLDYFTGKNITSEADTDIEAAEKRTAWLYQSMAPSIAPFGYHFNRAMNAVAYATDTTIDLGPVEYTGFGKDGLPVQPSLAALQTFGIKLRAIDLDQSRAMNDSQRERLVRDINSQISGLKRLKRASAISDEAYEEQLLRAREKKARLKQGLTIEGDEEE